MTQQVRTPSPRGSEPPSNQQLSHSLPLFIHSEQKAIRLAIKHLYATPKRTELSV